MGQNHWNAGFHFQILIHAYSSQELSYEPSWKATKGHKAVAMVTTELSGTLEVDSGSFQAVLPLTVQLSHSGQVIAGQKAGRTDSHQPFS